MSSMEIYFSTEFLTRQSLHLKNIYLGGDNKRTGEKSEETEMKKGRAARPGPPWAARPEAFLPLVASKFFVQVLPKDLSRSLQD